MSPLSESRFESLSNLFSSEFGDASELDLQLLRSVVSGQPLTPPQGSQEGINIEAEKIVWLCSERDVRPFLHHRGIRIFGATIEGSLDLAHISFPFPLELNHCQIIERLYLFESHIAFLSLKNAQILALNGSGLKVDGSFFMNGLRSEEYVELSGVAVGGNLELDGCKLFYNNANGESNPPFALTLEGADIKGDLFLKTVDTFLPLPIGFSVGSEPLPIPNQVIISPFESFGLVRLLGASVKGDLTCFKCSFNNKNGYSFQADGIRVNGHTHFIDCQSQGSIGLNGAYLKSGIDLSRIRIDAPGKVAFYGQGSHIGNVIFRGAIIAGSIDLSLASMTRNLELDGVFLHKGTNSKVLSVENATIDGNIYIRSEAELYGETSFMFSKIGGNVECDTGTFENFNHSALNFRGTQVSGDLNLHQKLEIKGMITLFGASIGGNLSIREPEEAKNYSLDLRKAHTEVLNDEVAAWPVKGKLWLDGFTYNHIDVSSPHNAEDRVEWLRLQAREGYSSQPYEQLSKVLAASGHQSVAKKILIAKGQDFRLWGSRKGWSKFVHVLLGWLMDFGYRPEKTLVLASGLILSGTLVFWSGYPEGFISSRTLPNAQNPSDAFIYSFNAFIYSVDTFVPLIDFQQKTFWLPINSALKYYLWLHISFGWFLSSLLVAGLSGLIRR